MAHSDQLVPADNDAAPSSNGSFHEETARGRPRRGIAATGVVLVLLIVVLTTTSVTEFSQAMVNGILMGLIIAVAAAGMSVIFGTTGVVNFAHGNFLAFGALVAYFLNADPSGPGLYLLPAALVAVMLTALLGALLEWQLIRRLRDLRVSLIATLVFLIGLEMATRNSLLFVFGPELLSYRNFVIQQRVHVGPVSVLPRELWINGLCLVTLAALAVVLRKTWIGQAIRAVADNPSLAAASGIPVKRVMVLVWALGTGLAAFSGVLLGISYSATWNMGFLQMLLMFAAMIIGGVGSAYGAALGGIVIGLVMQIGSLYFSSSLEVLWALAAMILILALRPEGVFSFAKRLG